MDHVAKPSSEISRPVRSSIPRPAYDQDALRADLGPGPAAQHMSSATLLRLQRVSGNAAVTGLLRHADASHVQRSDGDDPDNSDTPDERSRRSRPRNAPSGTRPIDQSGLDRETIHKIKDAIGAGPRDWVGITPDGHIITTDGEGNAEDHGHVSDYARSGAEQIPNWVWGLLAIAAVIGLIVLFATGVGEVGMILAGASAVVVLAVTAVLRRVRPEQAGPIAQLTGDGTPDPDSQPTEPDAALA